MEKIKFETYGTEIITPYFSTAENWCCVRATGPRFRCSCSITFLGYSGEYSKVLIKSKNHTKTLELIDGFTHISWCDLEIKIGTEHNYQCHDPNLKPPCYCFDLLITKTEETQWRVYEVLTIQHDLRTNYRL